jgi:peptidoglycan/LPS O-acetylase OafA/YrhL
LKNRKEIDGLRAIAVLPVVLFHAGILGFAGGYIGVDIFFVISGYLITSSILEDSKRNNFSIIDFYERRARRILPALSVVLFFTTILAYVFMPPNLLKSYSESLISVTTFASNVFFYITSGYFSTASDEKPLLHTWSLAVEEQYYLLFPLMVVVLLPLGRKKLISIIVLLTSISLIFSQYLSTRNADANFYLIFSRAWELFFGSIIAFFSIDTWSVSREKRELIGILGLLIIFYSIIFFDSYTPFPSFYTLAPVLGTFLIIIFVDSNTYVGRFLSNNIFVTVGLISYSLYLWHQPLFAFLRLKYIGEPPTYMFIGTSICAIFLAFLSWKYIETPFRNKINITRKSIFQYSITSIAIFLFIGFAGYFYNGFEKRFDVKSYTKSMEPSPKREVCHTVGLDYIKPINACKYFGQNIVMHPKSWTVGLNKINYCPSQGVQNGKNQKNIHRRIQGKSGIGSHQRQ